MAHGTWLNCGSTIRPPRPSRKARFCVREHRSLAPPVHAAYHRMDNVIADFVVRRHTCPSRSERVFAVTGERHGGTRRPCRCDNTATASAHNPAHEAAAASDSAYSAPCPTLDIWRDAPGYRQAQSRRKLVTKPTKPTNPTKPTMLLAERPPPAPPRPYR